VPDAPVDHGEVFGFEVDDDFGGPVVGDVDPEGAGGCQGVDAEVEPVVGEGEVFICGHGGVVPDFVGLGVWGFVFVVVSVEVEGGVCEDEVD